MVDEFQDTNPLQVSIIQAFCGDDWRERGLFAVGDFKQSIYRFNGAEPRVSTELAGRAAAGGAAVADAEFPQPAGDHRFRERGVSRRVRRSTSR